jgi:hypothetical protein
MKKSEIAAKVFERMDVPAVPIDGGALTVPVEDLAGLALVPWFCDASVQWAVRLTAPGGVLKKTLLPKVGDAAVGVSADGALLAGVPGDGIRPSTWTLAPLAAAVAAIARPGMTLELATANLGEVKRDRDVKSENYTAFGDQCYVGTVDAEGRWAVERAVPALGRDALAAALECGRMVARNGPWRPRDDAEARAVVLEWLASPEANINPRAVEHFVRFADGAFVTHDEDMARRLYGLGLGFFRRRLADGPFHWAAGPSRHAAAELEAVARKIVAGA